ncbi:MAG: Clp protease N-terminal domain-containing protein, partial [Chloroflexia bacterium]
MREEFDRFTIQARNVLQHAQEEADRFYDDYISPEHILLGLLNEQEGVAVHVLTRLRFEPESARRLVELPMKYGERPRPPWSKQGLSPGAQLVIQLALDEARRLNHNYVGTHHLLLGVVAEGESPAADFLASHGAQVETVRAAVAIIHRIVDEPDEIFDILALGQGAVGKSEADRTERFDLGDTVKSGRSRNRGGDSLVEALDEIYDTLLINDSDVPDAPVAPKGKRGAASASGKRNGHGAGAHGPVTEGDDGIEVVSLDVEVEEAEPEEGEPDAAALARVGEVVEEVRPEDLEKVIDRALNMEGISVDDPVRIYLREIGRTALLKPPDESALASKMA